MKKGLTNIENIFSNINSMNLEDKSVETGLKALLEIAEANKRGVIEEQVQNDPELILAKIEVRKLLQFAKGVDTDRFNVDDLGSSLLSTERHSVSDLLEAIVLVSGRPSLVVNDVNWEEPSNEDWKKILDEARSNIEQVIPSVGAICITNPGCSRLIGTGWRIGQKFIVTNKHVVEIFANLFEDGKFEFKYDTSDRIGYGAKTRLEVVIDFKMEFKNLESNRFAIKEITYWGIDDEDDIAILELEVNEVNQSKLPSSLILEKSKTKIKIKEPVLVIGYPVSSPNHDEKIVKNIFGETKGYKQIQPGRIKDCHGNTLIHDCSTLGGNSGSPIVSIESGKVVGLHHSGEYQGANYGLVSPRISEILKKLNIDE